MPRGTTTLILPFGPCTSTAPSLNCTFTPDGTGITLFPIRDIAFNPRCLKLLPHLAQQLAADALFAGRLSCHYAAWRGKNRDTHAPYDWANSKLSYVTSRSRPRNALEIGNNAAPLRRVSQKDAQSLFALFIHDFVIR